MQKQSSVSQAQKDSLSTTQGQDPISQLPFHFHLHNNKSLLLDEDKFHQSLVTHPKTSKAASYETGESQLIHQYIKDCQKVLKTQEKLSNLHFALDTLKHTENKLLLPTMRYFPSLSSLRLQFSGNFQNDEIPQEILLKSLASLKHLNHLDLTLFFLVLDDATVLKKLMKTIRKLRRISSLSLIFFNCYGFTPSHYNVLLSDLAKTNQLRTLKLSFDNSEDLSNSDIEIFAAALPKLSLLTKIDLIFEGQRMIQEPALVRLFKAFQSLKNLSDLALNLQGCGFAYCADGGVGSTLESFRCLVGTSVQKLTLSLFQNLSSQNLQELSETLKEMALLQSLSLNMHGSYGIISKSITSFGSALACLTSLTSLSLHFPSGILHKNLVGGIASALMSLQNLISLKLEFRLDNETEDQHFQSLFANFKNLKSLKYLDIQVVDQETITDTSLQVLGESLKELSLLKSLSLDFTDVPLITSKGAEAILSGIQEGPSNLFNLNLKYNNDENLSQAALRKLGEALQALVSLYSVDLYLNANGFKDLWKTLKGMKNLGEVKLSLPESEEDCQDVCSLDKIKNIFSVSFFKR